VIDGCSGTVVTQPVTHKAEATTTDLAAKNPLVTESP
jgi:hypothetical protein